MSAPAVAVVAAGGLLIYAGIRDVNPLAALRDVTSGRPPAVANRVPDLVAGGTATTTPGLGGAVSGALTLGGSGAGARLVAATTPFRGDRYSQSRRWEAGFSDCSSFVGKAFKALGITPPGASTTWEYLAWSRLSGVKPGQEQAGDLVVTTGHMIMVTGPGQGIGQQNAHDNVRSGPISSLIGGGLVYLRYPWGSG